MKHVLVLLSIAAAMPLLAETSTNQPLTLAVSIPLRDAGHYSLERGKTSQFFVILSNTSNVPQRVWAPWDNLKYVPLHFEFKDSSGKQWKGTPNITYGVSQRQPDISELQPGESLIFDIDYSNTNAWNGFPRVAPPELPLSMRVVYENPYGRGPEGQSLWTGSVSSKSMSIIIRPP
jgi:hypothetical protein